MPTVSISSPRIASLGQRNRPGTDSSPRAESRRTQRAAAGRYIGRVCRRRS